MVTGGNNNNNSRQRGHPDHILELVSRFVQQLLCVVQQILRMYVLFGNKDYDDRGYHEHDHSGINPFWNPWFWASIHRSRMCRSWSTHYAPTWISSTNNNNPLRSYVPSRTISTSNQPHDSDSWGSLSLWNSYLGMMISGNQILLGTNDGKFVQWQSKNVVEKQCYQNFCHLSISRLHQLMIQPKLYGQYHTFTGAHIDLLLQWIVQKRLTTYFASQNL